MAHYRKPLAAAVVLNTAISVVEAIAGLQTHSLSLLMDSLHNFSDELALVLLFLAFVLSERISRNLVRSANLFNSVGLIAVSALLIWQAIDRLFYPETVLGLFPIVVGLGAAAANWGVARLLRGPSRNNAAIRLAYIHNLGDVWVSLAPVVGGLLITVTGFSIFDPLVALLIALWVIVSTVREVIGSRAELIWPEKIVCGHPNEKEVVKA